ncbi:Protein jagged-1 [Taenia crassiceps]|uniref:Protein jagged-1 n=1 Tax=Taenia crassiceps TaxID=6207 RepID=A0ABR4QSZ2_9CEST
MPLEDEAKTGTPFHRFVSATRVRYGITVAETLPPGQSFNFAPGSCLDLFARDLLQCVQVSLIAVGVSSQGKRVSGDACLQAGEAYKSAALDGMWYGTIVKMILLVLAYVPVKSINEVGKLHLLFDYSNPNGTLMDGHHCDFGNSCDVFFVICLKSSTSTSCDMYNETTRVYSDVTEVRAAGMNETVIPLIPPVSKIVTIVVEVWDYDLVSSNDFIAQFHGTLNMEKLSRSWSTIPLSRNDLVCANTVSMKAYANVDCPGQETNGTCSIVCRPREGVNTCDADGTFICQRGFTGQTCDQIDYCLTNNCADYATCQPLKDGYRCICKGHEGRVCEKGYNPCLADSLCGPHGQCRAEGPEHQCVCEAGWGGKLCDRETTPCERAAMELGQSSVCLNGGSCQNTDDNSFYCQCPQPGAGPRCELVDVCAAENCSGHGTCVFLGSSFHCECDYGWTGVSCSHQVLTPCQAVSQKLHTNVSMVCLHGGTCVDNANGVDFSCECPQGWFGRQCEIFFTQTLYFILPMAILPLLIIVFIAATYRRLRRRRFREKAKPITYASRRVNEHSEDSDDCNVSPYAIYIPSGGGNAAYRQCNVPYYIRPVRDQGGVTLCRQNSKTATFDRRKSSGDLTPVLPPRSALRRRKSRSPTETPSYANDFNTVVEQQSSIYQSRI